MTDKFKTALEALRREANLLHADSPDGRDHIAELTACLDDALDLVLFIEADEQNWNARDRVMDAAQARHDYNRGMM